jgi:hypothetical protein
MARTLREDEFHANSETADGFDRSDLHVDGTGVRRRA